MNWLDQLVCSRVRADILGALFGVLADNSLGVREIQRRVGLSIGTERQDLDKLTRKGF